MTTQATSMEERMAGVEATLPFLATKADLERVTWRLGGLIIVVAGVIIAAIRYLP